MMTVRQRLGRARAVDRELEALAQSATETRERLESVTRQLGGEVVSGSKDPHKFDELAILEGKIAEKARELCTAKFNALSMIARLEDTQERAVLTHYYVRLLTWEETAVEMHYSWRKTMYLKKDALRKLEAMFGSGK